MIQVLILYIQTQNFNKHKKMFITTLLISTLNWEPSNTL